VVEQNQPDQLTVVLSAAWLVLGCPAWFACEVEHGVSVLSACKAVEVSVRQGAAILACRFCWSIGRSISVS
jgi:hypothetical protein